MRYIILLLLVSLVRIASAQRGLEHIIVENYYTSNKEDENASGNKLKRGSITYRIYADLLPGYKLQAVYGIPGHPMFIKSTADFFNADSGVTAANLLPVASLKNNVMMLDSWFSVGAASEGSYGVLKTDDKDKFSVVAGNKALQNDDKKSGVALSVQDGLAAASPQSAAVFFGLDSVITLFNMQGNGSVFYTDNGSWASFGGAAGADSSNKVLIAQLTTTGKLSFELNIQLGTPSGSVQNFVARNPKGDEIFLRELIFP